MRSQPRVLIAVSLLAAIVPWDLERLDATGPLQASYGDRRSTFGGSLGSAMTTTAG